MSAIPTRTLGGTASDVQVGCLGFGLLKFTWTDPATLVPDEQAFECLRAAVESGVTYWNSATFYGTKHPLDNLALIGRFFAKYPQYASKVVLGVKGGFNAEKGLMSFDTSEDNMRKELREAHDALGGHKSIDVYGPARRDTSMSMEDATRTLAKLADEGLFSHIGLSEVNADSIRRAHAVRPIASVEIEYSPFSLDIEQNGVLDTCKELGIAIIAYSPLSRGFFTGSLHSRDELPQNDIRRRLDRFNEDNFQVNLQLTEEINQLAQNTHLTAAQLTLAWEMHQYNKLIPIPGTTKRSNLEQNIESARVDVPRETLDQFRQIADAASAKVRGHRYNEALGATLFR